MTVEQMLDYFKDGTMSKEEAAQWISVSIEHARLTGQLEALDKIETDLAVLRRKQVI